MSVDADWLHTYGMWPVESSRLLGEVIARAELSARDYKVLYWRFVCGMTQEHIGEHLGITQAAAGVAVKRAVDRLRIAAEVPLG